jgi:hypothetical protein
MAWRSNGTVHFASDSRITVAGISTVDVAIKVSCIPYQVVEPSYGATPGPRAIAWPGELGMCFAGSAINSLFMKESLVEIMRSIQYAPGFTDISMSGIMSYVFPIYEDISKQVCATVLGSRARADVIMGGRCARTSHVRVFHLSTDDYNHSSMTEILTTDRTHLFIGSGAQLAETHLPSRPTDADYLSALQCIINDPAVESVGGHMQYGCFEGNAFRIFGIAELSPNGVHYWRGAIDMNSDDLMKDSHFVPAIRHIDPFKSFVG